MPKKEFTDIVKKIKDSGKGHKMSIRDFLWDFYSYEKRSTGNVWQINHYLHEEKLTTIPNYQNGWIDGEIELKEKDKAKIKLGENEDEKFDPVCRFSILGATSKTPVSVKLDTKLEKASFLMIRDDYSQLPVMKDERTIEGIINWQTIAQGHILKKESDNVKDYMSNEFTILEDNISLFDGIKAVIKFGVVFVRSCDKKIKGPVTTSDLNDQFLNQIEPPILLEEIENYIRLILHGKIVKEELLQILRIDEKRKIDSINDMNFGEYILVMERPEFWNKLRIPFDKTDFIEDIKKIRLIRNAVQHFHPDKISQEDLELLRKTSKLLKMLYN